MANNDYTAVNYMMKTGRFDSRDIWRINNSNPKRIK